MHSQNEYEGLNDIFFLPEKIKKKSGQDEDEEEDDELRENLKNELKRIAHRSLKSVHENVQEHSSEKERQKKCSFISFDDWFVLDRLRNTGWNPRFGISKLIPLCVVTN